MACAAVALGTTLSARVTSADAPVTVAAVGDVALAWRVDAAIRTAQYDPFREVRSILAGADLALANVECVITNAPEPRWAVAPGQPLIRATPTAATVLASAGIDIGSVANNHAFDFSARGALDTHQALRSAGLVALGGGASSEDAWQPFVREIRGVRVGVLAMAEQLNHPPGPGARVAMLDRRAIEAVRALESRVDVVLLSIHWGHEFVEAPTAGQVALAHRLIDAGADVIIGHHPHVLQSVEVYHDRPIVYSLGNFVFGHQPSPRDLSAILELSLERASQPVARVALRPIVLQGRLGTPTPSSTPARAAPVFARLRSASARFRTVFAERDGALEVVLARTPPARS
jgi:poly-gamma-glutamate capsule biosynthesis protein CapA/YwtB (metallophosphatase superfamily)